MAAPSLKDFARLGGHCRGGRRRLVPAKAAFTGLMLYRPMAASSRRWEFIAELTAILQRWRRTYRRKGFGALHPEAKDRPGRAPRPFALKQQAEACARGGRPSLPGEAQGHVSRRAGHEKSADNLPGRDFNANGPREIARLKSPNRRASGNKVSSVLAIELRGKETTARSELRNPGLAKRRSSRRAQMALLLSGAKGGPFLCARAFPYNATTLQKVCLLFGYCLS